MASWWGEPAFWRDLEPFLFSAEALATADDEVADLIEWLSPPEGGRILDAGCGIGRHLVPLARRGFQVVGLDSIDDYRRRARQRLAAAGVVGEVVAYDAFAGPPLPEEAAYDAVLCSFALLGYHEEAVQDVLLAKEFARLLKPGGRLLIQTRHPEASFGRIKHTSAHGMLIEERRFDRPSNTLHTYWTLSRGGKQREYRSKLRVYTPADLSGLLQFCGFENVRVVERVREHRIITMGDVPATPSA